MQGSARMDGVKRGRHKRQPRNVSPHDVEFRDQNICLCLGNRLSQHVVRIIRGDDPSKLAASGEPTRHEPGAAAHVEDSGGGQDVVEEDVELLVDTRKSGARENGAPAALVGVRDERELEQGLPGGLGDEVREDLERERRVVRRGRRDARGGEIDVARALLERVGARRAV